MIESSLLSLFAALHTQAGGGGTTGAHRRARGQVFTPPGLADAVARLALAGRRPTTVLDPAAGDGALLAAVARIQPTARLVGIERDVDVARRGRRQVPGARFVVADALAPDAVVPAAALVIANPPFVRSIRLRADDPHQWAALRGRFAATSHGEWDVYGAFLEASLGWLTPRGRAVMIVPSRWLTARWAGPLRAHLAARSAARAVIDLGASQLFAGATTYTSVVVLEPARAAAPMALYQRGPDGWRAAALDVAALADAPWIAPAAPAPRGRRAQVTLGEVAHMAKGAGTNADGVFVLAGAVRDGRWVVAGDVVVEAEATRPCLRGRDVGAPPVAWCLVPYLDGRLLPWAELVARWPRAAAYLEANRARLEARERGRFTGERFHGFGRPQNLQFHLDPTPKVVVPDVVRAPRAWLDATGALVLDSAYALRPRPTAPPPWDRIETLAELLRSDALAAWLARASVPLRGDYRRIKTGFLAPMPLP
ncbi:MAG: N-6 DNA methylase [Kofleriaceae bacterium]